MNSTIGGVKKKVPSRQVVNLDEDEEEIERAPMKKMKKVGHSSLDLIQECDSLLVNLQGAIDDHTTRIQSTLAPEEGSQLKGEGDPIGLSGLNYALLSLKRKIVGATEQITELTNRVQL